jgi:hypothetical protein
MVVDCPHRERCGYGGDAPRIAEPRGLDPTRRESSTCCTRDARRGGVVLVVLLALAGCNASLGSFTVPPRVWGGQVLEAVLRGGTQGSGGNAAAILQSAKWLRRRGRNRADPEFRWRGRSEWRLP